VNSFKAEEIRGAVNFFACFLLRGRLHWGFLPFRGGVYGELKFY
jgi:hypothetical protein